MLLQTTIPARRDGTVLVDGLDGRKYVFSAGADGLECEVGHQDTVAMLVKSGMFYPANPGDYDVALDLTVHDDEAEEDSSDDENAPPMEAMTAPKRRGRKPKAVQ